MRISFWYIVCILYIVGLLCCGRISEENNETTAPTTTAPPTTSAPRTLPPTTVPPNVNTTPILASELQADWAEEKAEYEEGAEEVQTLLDILKDMIQTPDPDYEAIDSSFAQLEEAMIDYRTALRGYYHDSILLEHTTPIEDDLLKLKKDTLPFGRPHGDMYTMGELNMQGESIMNKSGDIRSLIRDGIDGQDVREELIEDLQWLEGFLPGYYDMEIGYKYYHLSYVLFKQSLYSDILIRDCNPHCV